MPCKHPKNSLLLTEYKFTTYFKRVSTYSAVLCEKCGKQWRTKARYVKKLKDKQIDMFKKLPTEEQ